MPFAIMRAETRKGLDHHLLAHCAGESRPDHARPGAQNHVLYEGRSATRKRLRNLLDARQGQAGRPPNHAVEFLLAGPPRYAHKDAWSADTVEAWAADAKQWIFDTFPSAPVAIVALHTDEASPHVHAVMVPETPDGTICWSRLQRTATGQKGPACYRALQDSYHATVGAKYGLERGERGSDRKHRPLTQRAGVEALVEEMRTARRVLTTSGKLDAEERYKSAHQRVLREYANHEHDAEQRMLDAMLATADQEDALTRVRKARDEIDHAVEQAKTELRDTLNDLHAAEDQWKQVADRYAAQTAETKRLRAEAEEWEAVREKARAEAIRETEWITNHRAERSAEVEQWELRIRRLRREAREWEAKRNAAMRDLGHDPDTIEVDTTIVGKSPATRGRGETED